MRFAIVCLTALASGAAAQATPSQPARSVTIHGCVTDSANSLVSRDGARRRVPVSGARGMIVGVPGDSAFTDRWGFLKLTATLAPGTHVLEVGRRLGYGTARVQVVVPARGNVFISEVVLSSLVLSHTLYMGRDSTDELRQRADERRQESQLRLEGMRTECLKALEEFRRIG